jgi:DNA-binding IclR family transcriptional regulator
MLGVQIMGLDHIVTIAAAQGAGFQLNVQVGSRFPALISATGRCIAAWGNYSPAELEPRFAKLRWEEPPSFAEWQAQVAETREQGFGIDEGNYIAGVTLVAAPVWKGVGVGKNGRPSHALVAIGIGAALKRNGLVELEQALVAAARSLTGQLGGIAE